MAQIVGVVAAQIALDEADKMLQNQGQNQSQSPPDDQDDQSFSLSAPSGAISSLDPMQLASSLLPDNLDSVLQINGSGGGQNLVSSVIDEGEDILDQGVSMGMSFMGK
ncbi:hypothetical protein [Legionella bozemanae]|uniref:Uncharacterized protein n=1 Tax=Legionella bozemanae TaxID=447 RepID=A0A0W0RJX2_LEGBO|nr:hypothetical protein [Legionella bozemanae]KTC71339.1 hypothetical protein Lboz_2916 [Legionella bozemanae]STO35435.1 Uncharacterised protein [Legionella bozemanae]